MLRLSQVPFSVSMFGRLLLRVGVGFGLALLIAGGTLYSGTHHAFAGGCANSTATFVHTATPTNTFGDYTFLDESSLPALACGQEVLFATPVFDPSGDSFGTMDNHPFGFWFDLNVHRWAIFNEDGTAMPLNVTFYVHMTPPGTSSPGASSVFVQTATEGGYITYLNDPTLNGNPSAQLLVTQNLNYGHIGITSVRSVYDPHEIGIWYDSFAGKWTIYNEDLAAIPTGAEFDVLVAAPPSIFVPQSFTQTATTFNTSYAPTSTCITNSLLTNGNSLAFVFVTHLYSGYFTDVPGVWYADALQEWCIFDISHNTMPVGAQFSVLIF
ncbi:MAG TPA: hypothetical protein VKT82_30775 [Ktedonobacterales bacterium]|nr:hypothetical protein [Ktedonobacterales bacterium]